MEKKEAPVSFKEGVAGVARHARPYKRSFIGLILLGLISAIANGSVPYVTGKFFDSLIALSHGDAGAGQLPLWGFFLGLWILIQFVANGIDWGMDRLNRRIDSSLHLDIQTEGFVHLLKLPLSFHTNEHINGILSRISVASWRISALLSSIVSFAPQLLSVVIGLALAASISLSLAGVLLVGVTIYLLLLIRTLRPIAKQDDVMHKVWNDSWNDAAEAVQQVSAVKQAAAEEYEIEKVQRTMGKELFVLWYAIQLTWSNISFFQRFVVLLTQIVLFLMSVHLVATGVISVGDLVALNGYALMFFGPFAAFAHNWQTIQNGLTSAAQLESVYTSPTEPYVPVDAEEPQVSDGSVVFDDVTLRYGDAEEKNVLHSLSTSIQPGETVALVGESGAGKSSLISLISGYYFPNEGSVRVDGVDTRRWKLADLRKRIAVVPQEIALFNDTIKTNIRYGSFDASDEQLMEAARKAYIHEYIDGLPQKYDTLVGERGVKLSVGQKQRIAIARAILRNPEILILDEPTSALDAETEKYITESLEELMRGRTTFIIAHRLSTVRKADRILLIKDGSVREQGNHEELMALPNGEYKRLYELHIGLHD